MSLPLQQHQTVVEMLDGQHVVQLLTLAVSVAWLAAELLSIPKARRQLDIPKGDWLTVSLGVLPVLGVAVAIVWQHFIPGAGFHPALLAPAIILCAAGIGLRTWSKIVLGRYYTFSIGLTEGHRILEAGPYRFVRHPLYLGTFLAVTGFPLLTQSWLTVWVLTLPTALAYGLRLLREEDYLLTQLGAEYRGYAQRTARLIPRIW